MSLLRTSSSSLVRVALAIASLGFGSFGCADLEPSGSGSSDTLPDGFISDSPNGNGSKDNGGEDAGAGGSSDTTTSTSTDNASGAEKAIIEADIIQVHGDQLFALSQYGGLSVVDMANPADLHLLGNYKIQGVPFEMYKQENIVYAMFSSYGRWECNDSYDSCEYISSSHIEALDVSNPAQITKVGDFDLPGEISDSRIVGDVLYAVSFENGYCWNCADHPETTVTSIQVANPAHIGVVDTVSFSDEDSYVWGWRKSITVTQDRMYVAGIEWNGNGNGGHSTIQVVDITDPTGVLALGASVEVAGQIESRWQMDEKDGVLRVISQPGIWDSSTVPAVQTFQVNSADSVVPIATKNLVLPQPERLRAARFDGDRLFAITAQQTDPLFTIDVSDAANPQQLGEVQLPGWIYYLEPRGDRLFALGFDNTSQEGSMNVSLFDVADLANPSLIQRVNFGGQWSWAPEDQDRIHKAFKVDNDLGTVFVPYGSYSWNEDGNYYYCGHVESGVQMVDFTHDSLTKRGAAPLHGFARRALMHEGTLFTVSESDVQAFDIADRDNPSTLDSLAFSAWSNQSARVGNYVVRVSADWWSEAARLDVVPANDPGKNEPIGMLDLVNAVDDADSECYGWSYFYGANMFALDSHRVALAWSSPYWYYDGSGNQTGNTRVVVVNIANPSAPTIEGSLTMDFSTNYWGWSSNLDGGQPVVQIGSRLVFRRLDTTYQPDTNDYIETSSLEVADLSNPAAPSHSASIPLPDGLGHSLLVKSGNQVLTSHWEPVAEMPGKVRFYLDRATIAGGAAQPVVSTNVPGALVSYDAASQHALTLDFHQVALGQDTPEDCWNTGYGQWYWENYESQSGFCYYMSQTLKLLDLGGGDVNILDMKGLDPNLYTYNTYVTGSRVFSQSWSYDYATGSSNTNILVMSGPAGDTINTAKVTMPNNDWVYAVAAEGNRVVLASYSTPGIHTLDATDMDNIVFEKKADVTSYVYAVTVDGDRALCSMGPYGLESVSLQ